MSIGKPLDSLINVLFVDDCADDVEILHRHLESEGLFIGKFSRVYDGEALEKELKQHYHDWSIVILDHKMPAFESRLALEIINRLNFQAPVFIVAGFLDPVNIVETMGMGACDYIDKNDLTRLAPSIKRELSRERHWEERRLVKTLRRAIEQTRNIVIISDASGTIEYVNPSLQRITGYTEEEAKNQKTRFLQDPENKETSLYSKLIKVQMLGEAYAGEVRQKKKNGDSYWSWVSITPIKNDENEVTHVVIVSEDITELKELGEKHEKLALYDSVTGLANRQMFDMQLKQALKEAARSEEIVAVMYIDLDDFKDVNDQFGHRWGDELLIQVADALNRCVRREDCVARLGGDEFAILLLGLKNEEDADVIAKKINREVSSPIKLEGGLTGQVTASIGISVSSRDGLDPDELKGKADSAMYKSKGEGRNTYNIFTTEMLDKRKFESRRREDLKDAIKKNELVLHYQPRYRVQNGGASIEKEIIGVEALIRWQHPEQGLLPAVKFIDTAVDTGAIFELGEWVLRQCCRDAKSLQDMGVSPIRFSVNLSRREFHKKGLGSMVESVLSDTKLDPQWLEMEINDTILFSNIRNSSATLTNLNELGVSVTIDGFGKGFICLNELPGLPFDNIKIDRDFVKGMPSNERLVGASIAMANQLQREVVAVGIENASQLELLSDLDCKMMQGYYFCEPIPFDDFQRRLC